MTPSLPSSAGSPSPGGTLVSVRGADKTFGATRALASVDLDLAAGSIRALLGQNGAGKSTLIKVLAGVYGLDAGEVTIAGHPLGSPEAKGSISFIHQDLGLVPGLSVAENVALGAGYPRCGPRIDWRGVRSRARHALDLVGSDIDPRARLADLSRTGRSLVAIARALVVDARGLVLDEPTSSLPVDETHRLFAVLRQLRDDGMGLLYVSHRLDEVFELADCVTIMRDGRVVTDGPLVLPARPSPVPRRRDAADLHRFRGGGPGVSSSPGLQERRGGAGDPPCRPEREHPGGLRPRRCFMKRVIGSISIGSWGLPILTVVLFGVFAVLLPDTFPTSTNVRSILVNQSIPAMLALGATIPIVTGRFDLSIGYGIGLAHVLAMWLLVRGGMSWPLVCVVVILGGVVVGLVNGLLVEFAQIDSFIATLGWPMRLLSSSHVVVLGLGGIGLHTAELAHAVGARVTGVRRSGTKAPAAVDRVVSFDRLAEVLPKADILVSTLPGTPSTRGLLDAKRLALLPSHAVVVNVGRGSVLDSIALVEALDTGRLRGAVLDVTDVEPLPPSSPLWGRPDVVLSPHTAALTPDEDDRIVDLFCDNLVRFSRGEPLRNVVDPAAGY